MDLLRVGFPLPCHFSGVNFKLMESNPSLQLPKRSICRKNNKNSSVTKPSFRLRLPHRESYERDGLHEKRMGLLNLLEGLRNQEDTVMKNATYKHPLTDSDVGSRNIPGQVDQLKKILIASLPDVSNGGHVSPISSCYWEWKPKLSVYYEKSGMENIGAPAVLFLPGFGVGAFHYEKQLKDLGRDYRVWALDFLGQGMSLPSEDPAPSKHIDCSEPDAKWGFGSESKPWARDLVYSVDLWRDQVQDFIEQIIGQPVYVVGNSLGGFVALYFAARNPQLVKGVTLLNATPFWGFLPNPVRSPRWSKIFPWAGTFPLPLVVQKLTEFLWQKISEPCNIEEILKQVYADHSTKVDTVFSRIIDISQHPAAAAAFASIMFAPRGELSFQEALTRCEVQNVPICLIYGKEDPWVRPIWGHRVKRQLPGAPYYEISPAGHCPHDEVPEVVNYLLRGWIKNLESEGSISLPLIEDPRLGETSFSRELEYLIEEGTMKSVRVWFFGSKVSLWDQVSFFLESINFNFLFKQR
ncbi:hypothetical protein HPP92_010988 [Vanilla planifolia]|uniref:AB hydrolase-1 domain-containing protein n=1 Tax=Vanilla planifolia TaxID=51239 RepID=A0A835V1M6_VANPL|nr:hypothetical protein HPP92_011273 [Vanilla planifolia]KAG0482904.1 hypothetical protein HPP92_010988 [Vanilla planifolia]